VSASGEQKEKSVESRSGFKKNRTQNPIKCLESATYNFSPPQNIENKELTTKILGINDLLVAIHH
jgi:hypothetical protein